MGIREYFASKGLHRLSVSAKGLIPEVPLGMEGDFSHVRMSDGSWFHSFGGGASHGWKHWHYADYGSYRDAFFRCPPLAAVVLRKAAAATNGRTSISSGGRESKGREARKINALMQSPNPYQTGREFEMMRNVFVQVFGWCLVVFLKPEGFGGNRDATSMWIVPPDMLEMEYSSKEYWTTGAKGIKSIRFRETGRRIGWDDCAFFRDMSASFSSPYVPDSRIMSLAMPVNNIIGAYESKNVMVNSRGALGMITNQTTDENGVRVLRAEEKDSIQRDFNRMYGLRQGQYKMIISNANLKYQPMVMPAKDLMLAEEIRDNTMTICDVYGYPYDLMASEKGTSYNNGQSADVRLYQNTIIPEADNHAEAWMKAFGCLEAGIQIKTSYDHIAALQPIREAKGKADLTINQSAQIIFRNNGITMNEWRAMLGLHPMQGGDVYFSDVAPLIMGVRESPANAGTQLEHTYNDDGVRARTNNDGSPSETGLPTGDINQQNV